MTNSTIFKKSGELYVGECSVPSELPEEVKDKALKLAQTLAGWYILGESRNEYVARKMSGGRKSVETTDTFLRVTKKAADLAGDLLVAVDQEICGICRLHNLIPAFPGIDELASYDTDCFENISATVAAAANDLGVNRI